INDKVTGPGSRIAAAVRARSRPRSSSTIATSGRLPLGGDGIANRSHAGSARRGTGNGGGSCNDACCIGLGATTAFRDEGVERTMGGAGVGEGAAFAVIMRGVFVPGAFC